MVKIRSVGAALGCAALAAGCGEVTDASPDAGEGDDLAVVTTELPSGNRELAYEAELEATGGSPPYTWSAANLPPGVSADSDGVITGAPNDAGDYDATVTVTDAAGETAAATLSVAIDNDVIITTEALPAAHIFKRYEVEIEVAGGEPPHTFSASGLPPGLVILSDTGVIENDPADPAILDATDADVTITVVDDAGASDAVSVSLEIVGVAPPSAEGDTVSAGIDHTCAVDAEGGAWCWGGNEAGQLGTGQDAGDLEESAVPLPVAADEGQSFVSMSAGFRHSCAVDDSGTLWCWGDNQVGQLGTGQNAGELEESPVPLPVVADEGQIFVSVSTLGFHTCAIATDGAAWCWGFNIEGQLGAGEDFEDEVSDQPVQVVTDAAASFVSISAGASTCAMDLQGGAWCWGNNSRGQLGTGQDADELEESPVPLPVVDSGGQSFASISAGDGHSCAADDGGGAWCWGRNGESRLGAGEDFGEEESAEPLPVVTNEGQSFAFTGAGGRHSCALDVSGAAWCWGDNEAGRLGTGANAEDLEESAEPQSVVSAHGQSFASISAGGGHSCAADDAGTAWCWGANSSGQLGTGADGDDLGKRPEPVVVHPGP